MNKAFLLYASIVDLARLDALLEVLESVFEVLESCVDKTSMQEVLLLQNVIWNIECLHADFRVNLDFHSSISYHFEELFCPVEDA